MVMMVVIVVVVVIVVMMIIVMIVIMIMVVIVVIAVALSVQAYRRQHNPLRLGKRKNTCNQQNKKPHFPSLKINLNPEQHPTTGASSAVAA
jgi:biopolymer transport protein ExbB/TolQ